MIKFETAEELEYLRKVVHKARAYMMIVEVLDDNPVEDFTSEEDDDDVDIVKLKREVIMNLDKLISKCHYETCIIMNEMYKRMEEDKAAKE